MQLSRAFCEIQSPCKTIAFKNKHLILRNRWSVQPGHLDRALPYIWLVATVGSRLRMPPVVWSCSFSLHSTNACHIDTSDLCMFTRGNHAGFLCFSYETKTIFLDPGQGGGRKNVLRDICSTYPTLEPDQSQVSRLHPKQINQIIKPLHLLFLLWNNCIYNFAFSAGAVAFIISLMSPAASLRKNAMRSQPRCLLTMLNWMLFSLIM